MICIFLLCYIKIKNIVAYKCKYLNALFFPVLFEGTIIANKPATRIIDQPKVATSPPSVSVNEDNENVSEDDLSEEEFEISSDFQ